MSKGTFLLLGATIGAGIAVALNYFLGPASGTTYDANYRSRLDFALDEGRRAALEREQQLRQQLIQMRRSAGSLTDGAA
ncbi:MAG TPA: hypothetical protein DCL15_23540 [Chloroflexi bacterium]|nr:hypothetical protein [Chloroflexota bacterium]HHW85235.1 hypothetical protein [Chloroflexota bacterium]